MPIDPSKPLESILSLLSAKPVGWWLHYESLKRQAVPIDRAVLTNCHDKVDKEGGGAGFLCLPIDEVLGWTDSPQVALDFLTISMESLDAWMDMFVPVERRPSVPLEPVHQRHMAGKTAPDDQQVMQFPDPTVTVDISCLGDYVDQPPVDGHSTTIDIDAKHSPGAMP